MATTKNTPDLGAFLLDLSSLIQKHYGNGAPVTVADVAAAPVEEAPAKKSPTKAKASASESESDAGEAAAPAAAPAKKASRARTAAAAPKSDPWADRKDELMGKSVRALVRIAKALDYDAEDLADFTDDDKDELVDLIIEAEQEDGSAPADDDDADADDDTDTDDDEGDEDEGPTRDELLGYTLTELKTLAKDTLGLKPADLRGKDKDALIDLLLADADEEDEDEGLTADDLEEMSLAELKQLVRDNGMSVKRGSTAEDLINLLVEKGVATA